MPLTNPHAASAALRRTPSAPADIDQQAGMTASGKRPSSTWAAQASFDAEYLQWRGGRRSGGAVPSVLILESRGDDGLSGVDCLRDCLSCSRALKGLGCRGGAMEPPPA